MQKSSSTKEQPLVDFTTINGVQSVFKAAKRPTELQPITADPWGAELVERFIDLYIYNDVIRYTYPIQPGMTVNDGQPFVPGLLDRLGALDSSTFAPEVITLQKGLVLESEYLSSHFEAFRRWSEKNADSLVQWVSMHGEDWVRREQWPKTKEILLFSECDLKGLLPVAEVADSLGLTYEDLCYAFDVSLRSLEYARTVGMNARYATHPIRYEVLYPSTSRTLYGELEIPVPIGRYLARSAHSMTLDEFSTLLFEARSYMRGEIGIVLNGPRPTRGQLRELARELHLNPKFKWSKQLSVVLKAAAVAGATAGGPKTMVAAAIGAEIAVNAFDAFVGSRLMAGAAKYQFLLWAVKWDIEEYAKDS